MTSAEATAKLLEIGRRLGSGELDVEEAHLSADGVLLQLFESLSMFDVVTAWSTIRPKYYA